MKMLWIALVWAVISLVTAATSNPAMAADATLTVGQWAAYGVYGSVQGSSAPQLTVTGSVPGMYAGAVTDSRIVLYVNGTPTTPGTYTLSTSANMSVNRTLCPGDPDYDEFYYYNDPGVSDGCYASYSVVHDAVSMVIEVVRPTITLGSLTQTSVNEGVFFSQSLAASGGTGSYTYAVTSGVIPAGLTLSSGGTLSGTPSADGVFVFTVTATDSFGSPGSASYTLSVLDGAPVVASVSATVAANSTANAITPTVTSTASYSLFLTGNPQHGAVAVSGNLLLYTPTAGYSGADSFTYIATNDYGVSSPATVSLTVSAPTLAFSPSAGSLAGGMVGTAYSQTVAASNGTAPYTYAITSGALPAGLSLNGSTGTISGTPTAAGPASVSITATDAYGASGVAAYSIAVAVQLPVAANTSATVAAHSTANPVALDLSGGAATSVAVASNAVHGTASASGTTITYTPSPGYSGLDSFTYTATNASGTSAPATVTITVSAPTLAFSPAAGSLAGGMVGTAYSQTVAASNGTAPYTYAITSGALPAGLSLNGSTGTISGTPSVASPASVSITAIDAYGASGVAAYSIAIVVQPPVATNTSAIVAAHSTANPVTLDLSGGTATSVAVVSNAVHGTASASGTTITYAPSPGYSGADSFIYTATNASGTSVPATVTITVSAPTLAFSPAAGSLAGGMVGTAYSQTVAASNGTVPYTYAITSGALPAGLSLNGSTGAISGTPTTAGPARVSITATDAYGASSVAAYSIAVAVQPPVAANTSATVAAHSTANPVTLDLSGGAATSVAVASNAVHGTASASGTTITYTPSPGYSGSDSFTYTATNASGTSAPATVTITVSAPTLAFLPSAGSLAGGMVGTAYSQTVAASNGTAPYTYVITSGALPAGLSLNGSTGTISGTPSVAGPASVSITATDAYGASGVAAYSIAIAVQPPVAANTSAIVAAHSTANPVALDLSGGAATSVAVVSNAAHGTASASGTTITYTPSPGYSGLDSFTYTATNASGTSAPATVTITVSAPTLAFSPAAGSLAGGMVGTAYSQTVAASNGTAPYTYVITSGALPAGLSLNGSTGVISGTPATAGPASVSITATDAYGASGAAAYSIAVATPVVNFVFSPASGALEEAMAGENYSQAISATGGVGNPVYSLASGSLPGGMVLNVSTGELSGPLSAGTEGDYSFAIAVRDANGSTASHLYTLKVKPQAVTVADLVVNVPAGGTPPDVYLNRGATGGPFTSADLTFVQPANAGTARVTRGQLADAGTGVPPSGWYLQFTPNPSYSGPVKVGFRLNSVLGASNTGTVTYNLRYDADHVTGEIDRLVHDFVQTRQNLIASTIKVPGLLERRRLGQATEPVTTLVSPTQEGMTLGFSTSLAQIESARNGANAYLPAFNLWIDGALLAHRDKDMNGNKWGSFAMLSAGVDYLVTDRALVGLSFHYDRMTDPTDQDAELTGNGWLAGPYASFEIAKNLFWNTSLLYGGSANSIDTALWDGDFDTRRLLADTSLTGQWALDADTVITPKLRAVYFSEKVRDYTVGNSAGDTLNIKGFDQTQFRLSLGAEIARSFTLDSGARLIPALGLTGGVSGIDGAGAFGSIKAGLALQTPDMWMLDASLLFNMESGGETSLGARAGAARRF